jgi:hypothetical protein
MPPLLASTRSRRTRARTNRGAHRIEQRLHFERLAQHGSRRNGSRCCTIAGRKDHAQPVTPCAQALGKRETGHARHVDVSQQEIDAIVMLIEELLGARAIACTQHFVAFFRKQLRDHALNRRLIVD